MNKRIIVVMFDGEEPSADLIARISAQVKVINPGAESIEAFTYNFDELAAILVKKSARAVKTGDEDADVVATSLTVIGRFLADVPYASYVDFMMEVSNRIKMARLNMAIETNSAFIDALEIIEDYSFKMTPHRRKIMEVYKLSKEKLQFIITAYRIYKNGKDLA